MRVPAALVRVRPRAAALLAAAVLGVLGTAVAAPAAAAGTDAVTIDPVGTVAADGTVTLTGSYHCDYPGAVFLSPNLRVGDRSENIGNSLRATCDGQQHAWRAQAQPYQWVVQPGPAEADASLVHLTEGPLVPMPEFLARGQQAIMLQSTAD
ncbi:DUF6299 family protein [Kitasatospora sp. LaBMicrA B282]|uniref:DUF6299 family protein n=1 Tax=Kitasatospora sp. LaBMicrA B282 TaxID=3420949 RepID=UPI003D137430